MRALLLGIVVVASCTSNDSYLVITVDKRVAVHDPKTLNVTLTNKEEKLSKPLTIGEHPFPLTFSLSAPGRSGDLTIDIDALDDMQQLVGRGEGSANLDDMSGAVTLDSADFVVNTEVASDQYLTTDFEAVGFQLAAASDLSTWTSSYMEDCTMCNVFERRFDSTGLPVISTAAASDMAYPVTSSATTNAAMPAVAATAKGTLAFWDYTDASTTTLRGVACRAIDGNGATPMATQASLIAENADVVSATGLSNDNFAVVWQVLQTNYIVRTAIVKPDCTVLGTVTTANTITSVDAHRPHVAANGQAVLYSWIVDSPTIDPTQGGVRIRIADNSGGFTAAEKPLVANNAAQGIEHARVAPWGTGFAVAVRWVTPTSPDGPGKIEVYRVSAAGDLLQGPILITDQSRSDFSSKKGFSIAQRPDGALLVAWHVCQSGPGLCDVFGRILRPTGAPVGPEFMIPTSTASEQINPSVIALQDSFVAAWNDSSGEAPDMSGTSVRARILYPLYDDAKGVHGAACGASAPGAPACDDGLACAMGTDSVQRCYAKCTPPTCPGGGTCSTVDETTSACTF